MQINKLQLVLVLIIIALSAVIVHLNNRLINADKHILGLSVVAAKADQSLMSNGVKNHDQDVFIVVIYSLIEEISDKIIEEFTSKNEDFTLYIQHLNDRKKEITASGLFNN